MIHILEIVSQEENSATRKHAFFIYNLILRTRFNEVGLKSTPDRIFERNLCLTAYFYMKLLRNYITKNEATDEIFWNVTVVVEKLDLSEFIKPMLHLVGIQCYQSNHSAESTSKYWRRFCLIAYLDSVFFIISSLKVPFADENTSVLTLSKHGLKILIEAYTILRSIRNKNLR